jgi:hypothetical protein
VLPGTTVGVPQYQTIDTLYMLGDVFIRR